MGARESIHENFKTRLSTRDVAPSDGHKPPNHPPETFRTTVYPNYNRSSHCTMEQALCATGAKFDTPGGTTT